MGFDGDYDDKIFLSDLAEIIQGKEFAETLTLTDLIFNQMNYKSSIVDQVTLSDSLDASFELEIIDTISLQDIIDISREIGFGLSRFGLTDFGAQTVHRILPNELLTLTDEAIVTLTTA